MLQATPAMHALRLVTHAILILIIQSNVSHVKWELFLINRCKIANSGAMLLKRVYTTGTHKCVNNVLQEHSLIKQFKLVQTAQKDVFLVPSIL